MKMRRTGATVRKTQRYRKEAYIEQGGICFYCCEPILEASATGDHKVPLRMGGNTEKHNIVACCYPCNSAKGDMHIRHFMPLLKAERPPSGAGREVLSTWARRRIAVRTWLACERIIESVGAAA